MDPSTHSSSPLTPPSPPPLPLDPRPSSPDPLPSPPTNGKPTPPSHTDSPPYWQRRDRGDSIRSNAPTDRQRFTITLEDHTEEDSEQSKALWARGATIEEWTLVQGSKPASLGAYVVWVCNVQTQRGGIIKIRKRYSEFEQLRKALVRTFPHSSAALPPLPPKSILSRFKPPFLEKRRVGLQYFLTCVLLNPEFSSAPVLKEFMFER